MTRIVLFPLFLFIFSSQLALGCGKKIVGLEQVEFSDANGFVHSPQEYAVVGTKFGVCRPNLGCMGEICRGQAAVCGLKIILSNKKTLKKFLRQFKEQGNLEVSIDGSSVISPLCAVVSK